MAEVGVKGLISDTWNALSAPPGTPAPIVEKLNATLNEVLKEKALVARFEKMMLSPGRRHARRDPRIHRRGHQALGRGDQGSRHSEDLSASAARLIGSKREGPRIGGGLFHCLASARRTAPQLSRSPPRPVPSPFMNRLRISAGSRGVWPTPGASSIFTARSTGPPASNRRSISLSKCGLVAPPNGFRRCRAPRATATMSVTPAVAVFCLPVIW